MRQGIGALFLGLSVIGPAAFAQVPLFDMTDTDGEDDHVLARCGDVNGDGFPDFAVGLPENDWVATTAGIVRLHSGRDAEVLLELFGLEEFEGMGGALDAAGDVNADGFPDVIAGSGHYPGNRVRVWSVADGSLLYDLTAASAETLGWAVAGMGDADFDGFDDFAVSAIDSSGSGIPGYVRIHSGQTGAVLAAKTAFCPNADWGRSLAGLGDVTGDGNPDLAIYQTAYAPCTSLVDVVSLAGLEHTLPALESASGLDGVGLAGDADGDGLGDVVVGSPATSSCLPGHARVYSGSTGELLLEVEGESGCTNLGYAVDGVGDVNADGRDDFAAGAIGPDRIDVHSGLDAELLLAIPSPNGEHFGYGVVGLGDLNGDGSPEIGGTGPGGAWVISTCPGILEAYGQGCAGSGGFTPKLSALGCPNPGQMLTLRIREGYGGQSAFLAIGGGEGMTPLVDGCNLLVSPLLAVAGLGILYNFGPGWGYRDVPMSVPPGTAGLTFTFQSANLDPGVPAGVAVSNGLRVEIE